VAQCKPVLGMLNGDGAELIAKAQCGYCVPAGDYKQCSQIVKRIFRNNAELVVMGNNAKEYYERNFQKEERINHLENILKFICTPE
jgi:glycosyltransferase involved in cell wall biosynthesis